MTEGIEGVPTWVQTIIATGFFIGTMLGAMRGYIRGHLSEAAKDHTSSDTVVISAALADGKVIRELSESIHALSGCTRDTLALAERDHEMLDRICALLERQGQGFDRLYDVVTKLYEHELKRGGT